MSKPIDVVKIINDIFSNNESINKSDFVKALKENEVDYNELGYLGNSAYVSKFKYEADIAKANNDVEALKKLNKDIEKNNKELEEKLKTTDDIQKTLEEHKSKSETIEAEFKQYKKDVELKEVENKKESIVKEALAKNGCKSEVAFYALKGNGKYNELVYKDGVIDGLETLIQDMKVDENTKSLFTIEENIEQKDLGSGYQSKNPADEFKEQLNKDFAY